VTHPLDLRLICACSLSNNTLGNDYVFAEHKWVSDMGGVLKLAEALPHSQLTSLR